MKKTITKTELRKNIYRSEKGSRIQLGFWVDDEPYFISYHISEFEEAKLDPDIFETLCVNAFLQDLKQFQGTNLRKNDIQVYYRKEQLV